MSFLPQQTQVTFASAACVSVVMLVTACGSNTSPFVEQREVTAGNLGALSIGMTSDVALSAARSMGASLVAPIPCVDFKVSQSNLAELPTLSSLEGLRVTDYQHFFVDVYFADDKVSRLVGSPGATTMGLNEGDDLQTVKAKIASAMQSRSDLVAHAIVDHSRQDVVSLAPNPDNGSKALLHNCWRFEVSSIKPAGATYDLRFDEGRLTKIVYRRSRLRVE